MDGFRGKGKAAWLTAVFPLVLISMSSGCGISPFGERQRPRTPYARYQTLHGDERPRFYTDSFGREQPNLRARLQPMDAESPEP